MSAVACPSPEVCRQGAIPDSTLRWSAEELWRPKQRPFTGMCIRNQALLFTNAVANSGAPRLSPLHSRNTRPAIITVPAVGFGSPVSSVRISQPSDFDKSYQLTPIPESEGRALSA